MSSPFITPTLTLAPDARGNYVTWKKGKKQVRGLLTQAGFKPIGLFRARKENKNEFSILASKAGRTWRVTAARAPGVALDFVHNPISY